jgi:hypothetical protein
MPAALVPPQQGAIRLDRFSPAIHRVEMPSYNQRTGEFQEDLLRRRAQSAFLTIKYELIDAQEALDRMSNMESNWDSYGADPPASNAIRASREILDELAGALILPTTIVPSAEGGVSIYFMTGYRTVYIETYNSGSQALVMYDQTGKTEVLEIGLDIPRSDVSGRILTYLG